jgi:hypothetical protein
MLRPRRWRRDSSYRPTVARRYPDLKIYFRCIYLRIKLTTSRRLHKSIMIKMLKNIVFFFSPVLTFGIHYCIWIGWNEWIWWIKVHYGGTRIVRFQRLIIQAPCPVFTGMRYLVRCSNTFLVTQFLYLMANVKKIQDKRAKNYLICKIFDLYLYIFFCNYIVSLKFCNFIFSFL